MRVWGAIALAVMLGACGGRIVPPSVGTPVAQPPRVVTARPQPDTQFIRNPQVPAGQIVGSVPLLPAPTVVAVGATTAAGAGVVAGPPIAALGISDAQAEAARVAFRSTCPSLTKRTDASGLTRGADWQPACAAAAAGQDRAIDFFARYFEAVQVGDGKAFATGYYEPEIAGSRDRRAGYEVPVYGRPNDLIDVDLGQFSDSLKGRKIRGRVDRTNFVPYYDRTQIEQGAIDTKAPVLAWAADPIEMFFLQIQGSGRLRLPDGSVMRIGYATQNGRDYTGIGALMKQRGLLVSGQTSMQGIVAWLHAHPVEGQALMRENRSFVFFRELDGPPLGALGYAVTGQMSVAADAKFIPLGAPLFLSMDRADANGLWVAQDTGGAIKGANRVDTFWGAGAAAETIAGGMAARGTAFLLLPVGTVARLGAQAGQGNGGPIAQP